MVRGCEGERTSADMRRVMRLRSNREESGLCVGEGGSGEWPECVGGGGRRVACVREGGAEGARARGEATLQCM